MRFVFSSFALVIKLPYDRAGYYLGRLVSGGEFQAGADMTRKSWFAASQSS
jgi:hypothetical protein